MIDASIILGLKPPPDPTEEFAKFQGVRNMIDQGNLRKQQALMDQAKFQREQQQFNEADRAQAAQKLQGELIANNSAPDQTGQLQTNHRAVIQGLAAAGHGKEAVAYDAQRRLDEAAAIKNQTDKLKNAVEQNKYISDSAQSLLSLPDEALPGQYDAKLNELQQQGLVKPGQMPTSQQILQQSGGNVAALRQHIGQVGMQATAADKQAEIHQKDLEFSQKVNEFQQKVLEQAPKTKKEWTDLAGQVLGAAQSQDQWDAGIKNLAVGGANGGAPLDVIGQFGAMYSPAAAERAANLGMTPKDRADILDKNKPKPGVDVPLPADVAAQKAQIAMAGRPPSEAAQNTLDREAKQFGAAHAKSLDAANSQLEKIADARAFVNGGAAAQAVAAPKILTALVSGVGSGVRITQPEINAILKARGLEGDFEGFIKSISGQGKFTAEQQRQYTQILDDVKARIEQKREIANGAVDRINSAKSRDEIVGIDKEARGKIADLEKGIGGVTASGGVPTPASQKEYDDLPKGAKFKKPNDSTVYTKQ